MTQDRTHQTFHIMSAAGELVRRGVVLKETPRQYIVGLAYPLTGVLCEQRTYAKSATNNWLWFDNVKASNRAYRKYQV